MITPTLPSQSTLCVSRALAYTFPDRRFYPPWCKTRFNGLGATNVYSARQLVLTLDYDVQRKSSIRLHWRISRGRGEISWSERHCRFEGNLAGGISDADKEIVNEVGLVLPQGYFCSSSGKRVSSYLLLMLMFTRLLPFRPPRNIKVWT